MSLVPISNPADSPELSLDDLSAWNTILIKHPHFLYNPTRTTGSAFLKVVRELDCTSATWHTIWSTGFVLELAHLITRDHFCDFSRYDLTSSTGRSLIYVGGQRSLVSIMELFVVCLKKARDASLDDDIMKDVLHAMEHDFPKLWDNLWDVRTPFLDSQIACGQSLIGYPSVHGCIYDLACEIMKLVDPRTNTTLNPSNCRITHVLFFIWLHTEDRYLSFHSFGKLCTFLDKSSSWPGFLSLVAPDDESQERVRVTLLREYRDEDFIDNSLWSLNTLLFHLRLSYDRGSLKLPTSMQLDKQLLPHSLAGIRRQICRGDTGARSWTDDLIYVFFCVLQEFLIVSLRSEVPSEPLTRSQAFCIISLASAFLLPMIRLDDGRSSNAPVFSFVLGHCRLSLLSSDGSQDGEKMLAIRRHTRTAWLSSIEKIETLRMQDLNRDWRELLGRWRTLGSLFPPLDDQIDEQTSPFEPLERCGWATCLCSVHKPAHRLRVCKGCWVVAYCGPRCQTSDWEDGGHKDVCQRRTAA